MSKKKAQKAIDHWIDTRDNTLLLAEMAYFKKMWEKYAAEENDYRSGRETYGYEDDETIMCHMEYISDRWRSAFRIKWIIDGLENGRI